MIVIEKKPADDLALMVPTYYGQSARVEEGSLPDFGGPFVPVLVQSCDGVRVVLGTHDSQSIETPEIQIESRPRGWAIFLMPHAGFEASGFVYFLDDGRSFMVPEGFEGLIGRIEVVDSVDEIAELDKLGD